MLIKLRDEDVVVLAKLFCVQAIKRTNDKFENTLHLENADWRVLAKNLSELFSENGGLLLRYMETGKRNWITANIDPKYIPEGITSRDLYRPICNTVKMTIGYQPTTKTVKEYLHATMRTTGNFYGLEKMTCHLPVSSGYYSVEEILGMMDDMESSDQSKGFKLVSNNFYKVYTKEGLESLIEITEATITSNSKVYLPAVASVIEVGGKSYLSLLSGYNTVKVKSFGGTREQR